MEPGPLSMGMASGEKEMSTLRRAASCVSASVSTPVLRVASMFMPMPVSRMPPAMRRPGIEMPKNCMMKVPPMRKLTRMATM